MRVGRIRLVNMKPTSKILEIGSVPERTSMLLFVLDTLKEVVTELKLQKLIFQVQNEAKAPKGYRYFKHHFGPYSKELSMDTSTLMKEGLLQKERVEGREHPYWVFRITDRGNEFFNKTFRPQISGSLFQRMNTVLDKYSSWNHYLLADAVYKQWKIAEPRKLDSEIRELKDDLRAVRSFWEATYFPGCPAITKYLAFLEYSQEALEKISTFEDTVIKTVLIGSCRELTEILENIAQVCSKDDICPLDVEKGFCRNPDPSIYEVFDFIENHCKQNNILPKLSDRNLEELMTEEEYERLQTAFKTFDTSSSS